MSIPLNSTHKRLSLFTLVMMNVIAIDNLRSLTAGAEYGLALVFFYGLAALLFFVPTILVTAELATGWPNTGGVYIWVRLAFGARMGFFTIWLQWIYNVVWYPTIFAFMAGIIAYLIYPPLVNNKLFMLCVILGAFWGTTLINCFSLHVSGWVSVIGALIGTIFPMVFIVILGALWLYLEKPTHVQLTWHSILPHLNSIQDLAFLTNILFGLMGIEMSAVHAGDVHDPERTYPRALIYSAGIILLTLVFSCLAITIVIPVSQLNLVSGLIDAFGIFFRAYHMDWFVPVIAVLIILGSISGASAWILGPARGLLVAGDENQLPAWLLYRNKYNMPVHILFLQGFIVTGLCIVFLIMPSVNSSYWILSNLTAQLALIFYIIFFAAAIKLHYKHRAHVRRFKIPFGAMGIWAVCGTGALACLSALLFGFLPPSQIAVGNVLHYEAILIFGIVACCLTPTFFYVKKIKLSKIKSKSG